MEIGVLLTANNLSFYQYNYHTYEYTHTHTTHPNTYINTHTNTNSHIQIFSPSLHIPPDWYSMPCLNKSGYRSICGGKKEENRVGIDLFMEGRGVEEGVRY